jgi:hypothetical protein
MQSTGSSPQLTRTGQVSFLRDRLLLWSQSAQRWYDLHARAVFWLVLALFAIWAWAASQGKPIWYDEFATLVSATAPTIKDLMAALAKPVDANPPVCSLLVRLSIAALGYSSLAVRLPSFLGMSLFMLCLFRFVSRRLSPSYGVLAALLLLSTTAAEYAWEARPYALLLGVVGVAMVAYQRRLEQGSRASLLVFCLSLFLVPFTHYYGVLTIGAFAAAELARTLERRRFDWPLAAGLVIAPCAALFLLRNLIRAQSAPLSHFHSQGSLTAFFHGYELYKIPAWELCLAVAALAFGAWLAGGSQEGEDAGAGFSLPELILALTLLALPFIGAFVAKVSHAYVSRYFIAAAGGFAVLTCYAAASFRRRAAPVALLLSAVATAGLLVQIFGAMRHRHDPQPLADLQPALSGTQLPVVFQDAHDYVLARELNPEIAGKFYYVAEPGLAVKLTGTNSDDNIMRAIAAVRPEQILGLDGMARQGPEWIVVPSSEGWLVSCLSRMNADLHLVNLHAPGSHSSLSGYRVRVPLPGEKPVEWCEAGSASVP